MIYSKYSTLILTIFLSSAQATELTHRFVSPTNNGNALNGSFLLNQAEAQNNFKDPVAVAAAAATAAAAAARAAASTTSTTQSNLESFKNRLQQSILSRLSDTSSTVLFNKDGTVKLGSDLNFDLNGDGISDFSVVVDQAATNGNINIQISDGISSTILTVPYLVTTQ